MVCLRRLCPIPHSAYLSQLYLTSLPWDWEIARQLSQVFFNFNMTREVTQTKRVEGRSREWKLLIVTAAATSTKQGMTRKMDMAQGPGSALRWPPLSRVLPHSLKWPPLSRVLAQPLRHWWTWEHLRTWCHYCCCCLSVYGKDLWI